MLGQELRNVSSSKEAHCHSRQLPFSPHEKSWKPTGDAPEPGSKIFQGRQIAACWGRVWYWWDFIQCGFLNKASYVSET